MKKIIYLVKLLIVTSVFVSCQEKINQLSLEPTFIEDLASKFDAKEFTDAIPYQFEIDWSAYTKAYSEELGSAFYEFNVIYTSNFNPYVLQPDSNRKFTLLALVKENGE